MKKEKSEHSELIRLNEQLESFEKRLSRLEESISKTRVQDTPLVKLKQDQAETDSEFDRPFEEKGSFEFRIGEYGMAWLGNIVLLFGITFLVQYLYEGGNHLLSTSVGYTAIGGIYVGSFFLKKTYAFLSKLFYYNGHILLFYLTLRLHFFQENPLVKDLNLELLVLSIVLGVLLYLSYIKKSQLMSSMVLLMMLCTGIISNSTHFLLGFTSIVAVISLMFYYRFGWINLVLVFITLIYFTHLLWLLNNPFVTGELIGRETHGFGFIYLIIIGFVFSLLAILPQKDNISAELIVGSVVWNGLGFTIILLLTVFTFFSKDYALIFGLIALFCLIYSIMLQSRSFMKITASLYAIYAFVSISITIYGIFLLPDSYMLLSIQSFLVVSIALWFRSRFIVLMNSLLFIVLMSAYLKDPVSYNGTNFSFMMVAFVSARVMNWKKERLNLKTDLLRNLYLIAGFIMTLVAFSNVMPDKFVTGSWIFAAILFFAFGLIMKNVKYRWLAITAMIASAIRLVIVDMSNMDIGYRVLILLILAIISIAVSILYTKYFFKKKE